MIKVVAFGLAVWLAMLAGILMAELRDPEGILNTQRREAEEAESNRPTHKVR